MTIKYPIHKHFICCAGNGKHSSEYAKTPCPEYFRVKQIASKGMSDKYSAARQLWTAALQ
ncbi:MAG: hypothetical protein Q4Q53_08735 [Methanocorpusculum sp.]|nr:hypothetical protein [Methanocorpusculum sp.]